MKNNSKDNRGEIEIELLLREALSIKQEPSQQLNGSIVKKAKNTWQSWWQIPTMIMNS